MAQLPLSAADMEASLHVWLETEFTYFKVEQIAADLAPLARDDQDFILGWIRRIASTHITLAWQFGRRAPALLPRMERRLLEAWAVHTCDVFDRTGLQTALRVMEEVDSFDEAQHKNDAAAALFEDIAPVLGNFVCGLSGRRLRIEEGDAAWTDGERIVLPPLIAALPNLDDNFQLAKITVALLWAQTRFGSLRLDHAGIAAHYADPERAQRVCVYERRQAGDQERALRAGCRTAGPGVQLQGVPAVLQGLHPPPFCGRGDLGLRAGHLPQFVVLP